jgi:hypothetical protein
MSGIGRVLLRSGPVLSRFYRKDLIRKDHENIRISHRLKHGTCRLSRPRQRLCAARHRQSPQDWQITSQELGLKIDKPFSVRVRNLHGGRQEGVCLVDIDNGVMKISVVPTRGMNVLEAVVGKIRLGWDSPVSEVVNPAFIET